MVFCWRENYSKNFLLVLLKQIRCKDFPAFTRTHVLSTKNYFCFSNQRIARLWLCFPFYFAFPAVCQCTNSCCWWNCVLWLSFTFLRWFESNRIWAAGLIVGEVCDAPSHWRKAKTLSTWMAEQNVPGIYGIDTRQLTKKLRNKGTLLGKVIVEAADVVASGSAANGHEGRNGLITANDLPFKDPSLINLVQEVSLKVNFFLNPIRY